MFRLGAVLPEAKESRPELRTVLPETKESRLEPRAVLPESKESCLELRAMLPESKESRPESKGALPPRLGARVAMGLQGIDVSVRAIEEPAVRLVRPEDLGVLAGVLGRAFDADPVFRAILPDDGHRRRALPALFREWIRLLHLPHPTTSWTTEDLAGAALWSPPLAWGVGLGSILRMGPRMIAAMGARALPGLRVLHAVEAMHPREPHVYLRVLGCEPERQGRGIGSSLMRPMLARCDARGDAAYLESSSEKDVPLYMRHGFDVTGEVATHLGPRVWLMWRKPRR